jgi:predicted dehydrogenase
MYLNAEEKLIGWENFLAAIGSPFIPRRRNEKNLTSRDLLQEATRQGTGSPGEIRARYFGYDAKLKDPLRVGLIGTGDQGCRLIDVLNPAFVTVKSIADLRPSSTARAVGSAKIEKTDNAAARAATGLKKVGPDWKINTFGPYQELIAHAKDDGLEAVIIALPTHLHAAAASAALAAGLHVFLETPMALTVGECKGLVRMLAEKNKDRKDDRLCVAIGQQRRYSMLYDNAVALAQCGLLGKIHCIQAHWHCDKDAWNRDVPKEDRDVKPEKHGYQRTEDLLRWRLFERMAGGLMTQLGSHLIDACGLFLATVPKPKGDEGHPLSVAGSAGQLFADSPGDADDHVHCVFEYPIEGYVEKGPPKTRKKIGLQFALINGNDFDGYGELVLGTDGTLIMDREQEAMLYKVAATNTRIRVVARTKKDPKSKAETPMPPGLDPRDSGDEQSAVIGRMAMLGADPGYAAALEHWAWCVRNPAPENQPRCLPKDALATVVVAAAAGQAMKNGKRVEFDKEWFNPESEKTPEGAKAEK